MKKRSLLRWRRLLLGLTQDQVGQLADVDPTVVSRLELGFDHNVSEEDKRRVSAILGVPIKDKPKKG